MEVLGECTLYGYDISCSLIKTIESSSFGNLFKQLQCQCCGNTFHGFTHNYACQCKNCPNGIIGIGIKDLETLERIFSSSYQLASIICYALAFHHQVFINMFFKQWDEEKYQILGTIDEATLTKWHKEDVEYFETLGQEPEWDVHTMAYVELLQELQSLK